MKKIVLRISEALVHRRHPVIAWLFIAALLLGVTWLVYATGGVRYVFPHFMYIPILLAGAFFGIRGGVLAGLAGGLLVGPFMPIDTQTGELQEAINWLYRAGFFVLVGSLTGAIMGCLQKQIEVVRHQSFHDLHTGLPNKNYLYQCLTEKTSSAEREPLTLAMISLSNYFDIVNIMGHKAGDRLTCEMVHRIQEKLPEAQVLCQVHSDKLALLLTGQDQERALEQIKQVAMELKAPFLVNDIPVYLDTYIGLATSCQEQSPSAKSLMQEANIALDQALKSGQGLVHFKVSHITAGQKHLQLLGEIPRALSDNQFELHYQPKIDLSTGQTIGVEALLRWRHPQRGMIAPGDFIVQAEKTALIHDLTRWVLVNALEQLTVWEKQGLKLTMAVNISVRNFLEAELLGFLADQLGRFGIAADKLELEITESAFVVDMKEVIAILSALKKLGVRLSIDDFGTGYSSLGYLKHLPVDVIKIDQVFIRHLSRDPGDVTIVRGAITMAHSLGIGTVAEGVEDERAVEILKTLGCQMGQGYYFCRPQPADQIATFLQNHAGRFDTESEVLDKVQGEVFAEEA